jgi:hypothetical protein
MREIQVRPLKGLFMPKHWVLQGDENSKGRGFHGGKCQPRTTTEGSSNIFPLVDLLLHEDGYDCEATAGTFLLMKEHEMVKSILTIVQHHCLSRSTPRFTGLPGGPSFCLRESGPHNHS